MHQGREPRIEPAFKGNSQQNHGCIGIEMLLPRFMVRACLPGIEKANKIWPGVSTLVPGLVLLRDARQSGSMTGKLANGYPANITAPL
jgi:hypothetical protein